MDPLVVVQQVSVDDVGQLPLETSLGFFGCLQLRELAVEMGSARSSIAGLNDRCCVDRRVELGSRPG